MYQVGGDAIPIGSKGVIADGDPRMPKQQFEYPSEIDSLIEDAETRALLDEFIVRQTFVTLAEVLNRILTSIIESDNPKRHSIALAWGIGMRLPGLSSEEEVLVAMGNRSRAWLYNQRKLIREMLQI